MTNSTPLISSNRTVFNSEDEQFRSTIRSFIHTTIEPNYQRWQEQKRVDREMFTAAGDTGLLIFSTPEEYRGASVDDFRFNAIVCEEFARPT